jgi:hypothetical protein
MSAAGWNSSRNVLTRSRCSGSRHSHLQRQVAEGFGARPGGRLAVFWNAFDPPEELRAAFGQVFRRVLPDSPSGGFWARPAIDTYRAGCARVADVLRQAGAFGEPEEWLSFWQRPYTRDEWLDLVPTTGGFTRHPEAIQAELIDGLGAAVDAAGGIFTMSYTTIAATAARLGP